MYNPRNMENRVTFCPQANRMLDRGVEGEIRTARYLYENLKTQLVGNYRVLVNYNFPRHGTNTLEIDLLVITTFGVFLLEVKNWVGIIKAYDEAWFFNGEKRENIFGGASFKTKNIHSHLRNSTIRGPSFNPDRISVTSLIVLVRGTQTFENLSNYDSRGVVGLDQRLIRILSSTDLLHRPERYQRLSEQDITLVCDTLYRRHQPEKEEVVGDYRLLKKVRKSDLYEEFEAQSIHVETQRVRLKSYHLHTLMNERVTEKTIEHFKRDIEVVNSLGHHPNIVWTTHFFPDPKYYDLYYEITEPLEGERLDELMEQRHLAGRSFPLEEQITILDALCQALQYAHSQKPEPIYHRNVSFDTVFVTHNRRSNRTVVKLADFDFAKFGTHTLTPKDGVLLEKVFTSPEVLKKASDAKAYSDIYALGILWYFLAILPIYSPTACFNPLTDGEKIDALQLPDEARALLKRMVAYEKEQRPQSIEEVAEVVKRLRTEK